MSLPLMGWVLGSIGCGPKALVRDPRPNILLISLDTLRADRLSPYGYRRDTSPFLQQLADRGVLFTHSFVNTHGTPPSHATLFTSTYQQTHRVSFDALSRSPDHRLPDELQLLPEVLREQGYTTIGVTGGGYMSEDFGFDQGFDSFYSRPVNVRRAARKLLSRIRSGLGSGRPIFAFFHTYEIHSPYDPPRGYDDLYADGAAGDFEPTSKNLRKFRNRADEIPAADMDRINALYDAGIRFTDDTLKELFADLEATGFFNHHLTIITSDHGEEFGEHRGMLHPATLYDELLRVPLIVVGTGIEPRVENRLVSTVDVAPTIYSRIGGPAPSGMEGRDLLESASGSSPPGASESGEIEVEAIFAQYGNLLYGVRTERFKLVLNRRHDHIALYDLDRDPAESRNVVRKFPDQAQKLKGQLEAWLERMDSAGKPKTDSEGETPDPSIELDEERRRQLEALGYVDG